METNKNTFTNDASTDLQSKLNAENSSFLQELSETYKIDINEEGVKWLDTENYDLSDDFKEYLDLYFESLNDFLNANDKVSTYEVYKGSWSLNREIFQHAANMQHWLDKIENVAITETEFQVYQWLMHVITAETFDSVTITY